VLRHLQVRVLGRNDVCQIIHRRPASTGPSREAAADARRPPLRIAVPVHPPKAVWLNQLLLSLDRSSLESGVPLCEIVLLLTSREDTLFFGTLCATLNLSFEVKALHIRETLLDDPSMADVVAHLDGGAHGGMAVLKKLVGLRALALNDREDVLTMCIDADTLCMRWDKEIFSRVLDNYIERRFFGTSVSPDSIYYKINAASAEKVIDDAANGYAIAEISIYSWFFDVPTYSSRDILSFFDHVGDRAGGVGAFLASIEWHTFEHTMFIFYLSQHGAILENYADISDAIPELLELQKLRNIIDRFGYFPLWLTAATFFAAPADAAKNINPYFLSHYDRFGLAA